MEYIDLSIYLAIEKFENNAHIDIKYASLIKHDLDKKYNYWISPTAPLKTRLGSIKCILPFFTLEEKIELLETLNESNNYYENYNIIL